MINHFEHHTQITNKQYLFLNLLKYCEVSNHFIFTYQQVGKELFNLIPFTIIYNCIVIYSKIKILFCVSILNYKLFITNIN